MQQAEPSTEYRCPGERYAISRAVHLGRLARFYPGCRQCPHRDDTGTLSTRQVARLVESRPRGLARPLFHDEGAGGLGGCELTPAAARDLAAAFGLTVRERPPSPANPASCPCRRRPAADGRVRRGGRRGAALERLPGDRHRAGQHRVPDVRRRSPGRRGRIARGQPAIEPACVGLKFFAPGAVPISAGPAMETLERAYEAGSNRPARAFGPLRRFQIQEPYLAGLASYYHALRPLRFVLDSACAPVCECLTKLTSLVACEVLPRRTTRDALPEQVRDDAAHFAACVDGDGETCHFLDERGRAVPAERMALLISRHLLTDDLCNTQRVPRPCRPCEESLVGQVANLPFSRQVGNLPHEPRAMLRAAAFAAMQQEKAAFIAETGGRFWYSSGGLPLPDALMTISLLLVILSRSDRPFSESSTAKLLSSKIRRTPSRAVSACVSRGDTPRLRDVGAIRPGSEIP